MSEGASLKTILERTKSEPILEPVREKTPEPAQVIEIASSPVQLIETPQTKLRRPSSITPPPVIEHIAKKIVIEDHDEWEFLESQDLSHLPRTTSIPTLVDDEEQSAIVVTVKHHNTTMKSFKLKIWDRSGLSTVFDVVAEKRGLTQKDLVLTFDGLKLMRSTTPQSIKMQSGSVIMSYLKTEYDAMIQKEREKIDQMLQPEVEEPQEELFQIKVRLSASKDMKLRVSKSYTVKQVCQMIAREHPDLKSIRLSFDGEHLKPGKTMGDVDIEEDDLLELC